MREYYDTVVFILLLADCFCRPLEHFIPRCKLEVKEQIRDTPGVHKLKKRVGQSRHTLRIVKIFPQHALVQRVSIRGDMVVVIRMAILDAFVSKVVIAGGQNISDVVVKP